MNVKVSKKEFLALYEKFNGNLSKVGKELAISREAARLKAVKFGLKGKGRKNHYTSEQIKKMKDILVKNKYMLTKSVREIGISGVTFHKIRNKYFPELPIIKNFKAKISKKDLIEALRKTNGKVNEAGNILKLRFTTNVYRYIKYHNLNLDKFRKERE